LSKISSFLIITIAVSSMLIAQQFISTFHAYASESSPYNSGYDHGCDDAGISDPDNRYINQPEKGPAFHTEEFMSGYYDGLESCGGSSSGPENESPSERSQGDNEENGPALRQPSQQDCDPSYPEACIASPPPDLNCGDISATNLKVLPPDPHGFDRDRDGIGCES
jgi:hypothetical protein